MKYRFGYCSWLLTGSLPDRIRFLHDCGFTAVSLLQNVQQLDEQEIKDAAAAIREYDMTVCVHGNAQGYLVNCRLDEVRVNQLFQHILMWNDLTDGRVYDCCSDTLSAEVNGKSVFLQDQCEKLFKMEIETFSDKGIRYGLENTSRAFAYGCIPSLENMKKITGLPAGAGLLLDLGHIHITLSRDENKRHPADYLPQVPYPVHEIHISDNHGERDEHLFPGMGTTDYRAWREGLEAIHYSGVITLEAFHCADDPNWVNDISKPQVRDRILKARDLILNDLF